MDIIPINWKLIAHPVNWVTVILMLLIVGMAAHFILPLFGIYHTQPQANTGA